MSLQGQGPRHLVIFLVVSSSTGEETLSDLSNICFCVIFFCVCNLVSLFNLSVLLAYAFCSVSFVLGIMGQMVTTPLSLSLDHRPDLKVYANYLVQVVKKSKWLTFCSSEWLTVGVDSPRDGTFYPKIIDKVKSLVFQPGEHGYPDQEAYIVVWQALSDNPPSWVKPFLPR